MVVIWVPIIAPVEMPNIKIIHKFLFILFPIFFNTSALRRELTVMMHKDEPIITSGGISGNSEYRIGIVIIPPPTPKKAEMIPTRNPVKINSKIVVIILLFVQKKVGLL